MLSLETLALMKLNWGMKATRSRAINGSSRERGKARRAVAWTRRRLRLARKRENQRPTCTARFVERRGSGREL